MSLHYVNSFNHGFKDIEYMKQLNFILTDQIRSKEIIINNGESIFCINQFLPDLPKLQEAPDLSTFMCQPLKMPCKMPKLTAAPKPKKIKQRRKTEYLLREKLSNPVTLDDSAVKLNKRRRRTKTEMKDAREEDFRRKQAQAISCLENQQKLISAKRPRIMPRIKNVTQEIVLISNVGFAATKSSKVFKCVSLWCKYKSSDSLRFLNHLKNSHTQDTALKPHNFCLTCNVMINMNNLEDEFTHMMRFHVENNLSGAQMLGEIKTETQLETYQVGAEKYEIESSVIINSNRYVEEPKPLDEVDRQMYKLFEESSEKIEIIKVENLPNIEEFGILDESMEEQIMLPDLQKESVINKNESTKALDIFKDYKLEKSESVFKNSVKNTIEKEVEKSDNSLKNEKSSNSDKKSEILKTILLEKHDEQKVFSSKTKSKPDLKPKKSFEKVKESLKSNSNEKEKLSPLLHRAASEQLPIKTSFESQLLPPRRAISYEGPPTKCFKRSLSFVRNQQQTTQSPISENFKQRKSQSLIDKLIEDEKSVANLKFTTNIKSPTHLKSPSDSTEGISPKEIKSPPQYSKVEIEKQNTAINFEASSSFVMNYSQQKLFATPKLKLISPFELMFWFEKKGLLTNTKYEIVYNKMLQPNAIVKLFKCMGQTCSFTTSSPEKFLNHLTYHEKDGPKTEKDFYLHCAYCPLKIRDAKSLVHHVNDIHLRDVYQCSKCFYRSREHQISIQHVIKAHNSEDTTIYRCSKPIELSEQEKRRTFERLQRKRSQFVAAIRCQCCELKYFLLNDLMEHLKGHISSENENERKRLKQNIEILEQTFCSNSYGMFQCLFCLYGTSTPEKLASHMTIHPSETYFCCARQRNPSIEKLSPCSIQSTVFLQLPINVNSPRAMEIDLEEEHEDFRIISDQELMLLLKCDSRSPFEQI